MSDKAVRLIQQYARPRRVIARRSTYYWRNPIGVRAAQFRASGNCLDVQSCMQLLAIWLHCQFMHYLVSVHAKLQSAGLVPASAKCSARHVGIVNGC